MLALARRGFTLAELLVALVIFGIVGTVIFRVLVSNQRLYTAQMQRIDLQDNLRTAAVLLPSELRELDASEGDIVAMAADSIRIRAMRQLTFVCQAPVLGGLLTGRTMIVRGTGPGTTLFFGSRNFVTTTDSLLVYYEGNSASRSDDTWLLAQLTGVAPANCPIPDGQAGQQLTFNLQALGAPQANVNGNIVVGAPVRGFEYNVTYRSYQAADGKWYIGLRNAAGLTPLIGPLPGSTGLNLTYYDSLGAVTAVRTNVALIRVRIIGQTAQPVRGQVGPPKTPVDTMTTWITLRNNLRRAVNN
ncbi:MAG TPA: prepilin-type N-terminal cleavage/methylation domain-containing protein [Gemmatimonadales bacterium]|nr:prepilin-type N-terminal cleavage/methylation domain-containing protein [Gemmatimonadales bacterium]